MLKRAAVLGMISSICMLFLLSPLSRFLKIGEREPFIALASIFFVVWFPSVTQGVLRGLQRFYELGIALVSNSVFKLVSGIVLVLLGLRVFGALLSISLGMIVGFIISIFFLRSSLKSKGKEEFDYYSLYSYSLPVMMAMFCTSIPANFDVILAKRFFTPEQAGYYTCASIFGKIIFFFPSAIYVVLFPMVVEGAARGEDTLPLLKRSLLYTIALVFPILAFYLLFPHIALKLYSSAYAPATPLIGRYGIAMFSFSLATIILQYQLAVKNVEFVVLFSAVTFLEILLLFLFHSTLVEMISVLAVMNISLLILSALYTLFRKR